MPRKTSISPEKGDARTRLLDAARSAIRESGFAATSVETLCQRAQVTKGAYFHHFKSKEALGVAAADDWSDMTGAIFAAAPYHLPETAVERVLAYVDFRIAIIGGPIPEWTCLVGTMAQETHADHPAIRDACGASIRGHARTLESDLAEAIRDAGLGDTLSAASLALHMQAVIQGAFVVAKALNDAQVAKDSLGHLKRYLELTFQPGTEMRS